MSSFTTNQACCPIQTDPTARIRVGSFLHQASVHSLVPRPLSKNRLVSARARFKTPFRNEKLACFKKLCLGCWGELKFCHARSMFFSFF